MPVDRRLAENLARTMADLYGDVAERLAVDVARRLDRDLAGDPPPDQVERRLLAAQALTEQARRLVDRLDTAMADQVQQMVVLAQQRGGAEALRELGRLGFALPSTSAEIRRELPGAEAAQRLIFSLTAALRGTHLRITRWPLDVYREVVSRAEVDVLLGVATRRRAAQKIWEDLVSRGVTGFVDRSGRGWALESYVDMASRTVAAQATVEAHLDRLAEAGLDLVIVSDAPQECELCRPWEGQVLTRDGAGARTVEVEHATRDGEMVEVRVAGSVGDAVRDGLLHPNCRHSLSAYQPGITRVPTRTADPEGDQARQRLRRLERQVRRDKLLAETALTPGARAAATGRVRATQGRIRDHVAETGLLRQRHREQLRLGHTPPPGPGRPGRPAPRAPRATRATLATTSLPIPSRPGLPTLRPPAAGRDVTPELDLRALDRQVTSYVRLRAAPGRGDRVLSTIQDAQGFNGLPQLVDTSEMDALVAAGRQPLYRGIPPEFADQFRHGQHYPGIGVAGNGTYTTTNRSYALDYARGDEAGLVRMVLHPDSRVTTIEDIEQQMAAAGIRPSRVGQEVLVDQGRWAAAHGYDAYRVPVHTRENEEYWVILNRTALIVEEVTP